MLRLIFTLMLVVGCGSSGDGDPSGMPDYADQAVAGTINDKPWTYISGRAQIKQNDSILIELYPDNIGDVCADAVPLSEGRWAEFVVPDQKGETIYGNDEDYYAHVVVVSETTGSFTSSSEMSKTLIVNRSDTMVVGKFYFESGQKKNVLNGTFQVPTCEFE